MTAGNERDETSRFLWLFALAWAGGAIAYVPFLTILLPLRIVAMPGTRVEIAERLVLDLVEVGVELDDLAVVVAMEGGHVVTRPEP